MAKKYSDLRKKMSPESRAKSERIFQEAIREMPLHALRKAQGLTQAQLAATLDMKQASVSKIERQADLYVSTLRRFIEACGGTLYIAAVLPTGVVAINQFGVGQDIPAMTLSAERDAAKSTE